jgi:hypothetical protein
LDRRLYLPEQWFGEEYRDRWRKAQIPETTPFRTKPQLAAEMVEALTEQRPLRVRWMVCDEGYGNDPRMLERIAATGLYYLAEVPKDTQVWPILEPDGKTLRSQPMTYVKAPHPSGKGRPPCRRRLDPESPSKVRVDELAEKLTEDHWHRYRILEGAKGPLVADFAAVRAIAPRQRIPGPEIWVVIRRKVMGPEEEPKLKFYLSQAPIETPLEEMVRVSGMRWPIESAFAEAKGELGLDQYELRFYAGWHHHMTMVILAHHFLVLMQQLLVQRGGFGARGSEGAGDPAKEHGVPGSARRVGGTGTGRGDPTEHRRGKDAAASHPAAA